MNTKHLFWRIWYANPEWSRPLRWALHATGDQIDGWLYYGITVFGHSLLYSDKWRPAAAREEKAK